MAIDAPSNLVVSVKKVKDPLSNLQTGVEFTARLDFDPASLKIEAIIDAVSAGEKTFTTLSNYPPQIRIDGVTVPRDGLSHPVVFNFWHDDGTEQSDTVASSALVATFDLEPPADPTDVTVTVLRDRAGDVPDQIQVVWTSDEDVYMVCLDNEGKKRNVAVMSETESSVILEGMTKYGTSDGQQHEYRLGVQAYNRSTASNLVYAAPVLLTADDSDVVQPTPDDIAGTAEYMTSAAFNAWLAEQYPAIDPATVAAVWTSALIKVKDVIAKGGSVSLPDFGLFKAKWSSEKTVFRNGQYITIAPQRSPGFDFSDGFTDGVKLGRVMTDTEANLT